jgi:aspartyl protease family protein
MLRSVILSAAVFVFAAGLVGTRLAQMFEPAARPATAPIAAEAIPVAATVAPLPGRAVLRADPDGHYRATTQVDGHQIQMMVDTGASSVVLTNEDAGALGLTPFPSEYKTKIQTVNGIAVAARSTLRRVRVGSVEVDDVEALVMPQGAMPQSLLGMSFLRRLNGFEVSANRLVLTQ